MQDEEQLYIKGFNNGYLLAKHDPSLAALLTARTNDHSPYFDGMLNGKQEHDKETREWSKGFSRGGNTKDDRETNRER